MIYTIEAMDALALEQDWMMVISRGLIDPNCPYRIERDRMIAEFSETPEDLYAETLVEVTIRPYSLNRDTAIRQTSLPPTQNSWWCTTTTIFQGDVVGYRVWFSNAQGLQASLRVIQNGQIWRHISPRTTSSPIVREGGQRWVHISAPPANFYLRPYRRPTGMIFNFHGMYTVESARE
jgi:hypothetical protein